MKKKFCETKELLDVLNERGFRVTDSSFKQLCRRNAALRTLGRDFRNTKLWPLRSTLAWFELSSVRRDKGVTYDDEDLLDLDGGETS